uniref:HAT C-terminal dimerisation domain-containing protein n=1 Tax=Lactuca sativa TaxID=4236 RepID=A0A9R1WDU0_LACSA|nr:hypothetical protein LSAT_V11C200062040 [Lactuca sativa]
MNEILNEYPIATCQSMETPNLRWRHIKINMMINEEILGNDNVHLMSQREELDFETMLSEDDAFEKNELDDYIAEKFLPNECLNISISTVASESTFSMNGNKVTKQRSQLKSETVGALMCSQSWLWKELQDELGISPKFKREEIQFSASVGGGNEVTDLGTGTGMPNFTTQATFGFVVGVLALEYRKTPASAKLVPEIKYDEERESWRKKARSAKELKQGRHGKQDFPQLASFGGIKVPSLLPFFHFVEFLGLFMDFQVGMMSYGQLQIWTLLGF